MAALRSFSNFFSSFLDSLEGCENLLAELINLDMSILRLSGLEPDFSDMDKKDEWTPFSIESGLFSKTNKFKFNLKKNNNKEIDPGVKKQFDIITSLCNRDDVDKIVNAGDSDREGEIIVRLCIENALKTEKDIYRLWLPDQTSETISQGLTEMKLDSEYDNLANEGFARTYIDWLYGVNLTRYATLKTGTLLRVGRVIIPIVKAIYDRDMAIRNFVPEMYYGMWSNEETNGELVELNSKEKFDFLSTQKADLDETKAKLEEIIIDMQKIMTGRNTIIWSVR